MIANYKQSFTAPARSVQARVEHYQGSTLLNTFEKNTTLKSVTITREGEHGKFFGFGICQKAVVNVLDKDKKIAVAENDKLSIYMAINEDYIKPFCDFFVSEVKRNENTNELTITAYDKIFFFSKMKFADLGLVAPYTMQDFLTKIAEKFKVTLKIPSGDALFTYSFASGANFNGNEDIRVATSQSAEATGSIYFINSKNELVFTNLDTKNQPQVVVGKEAYFTMETKTPHKLANLASITELGDNIETVSGAEGETQYLRNNPWLVLRADLPQVLDAILAKVVGTELPQFSCYWRGNFCVEPCDKVGFVGKDDRVINAYLINDTLNYTGGFNQKTTIDFQEPPAVPTNPTTIGEAISDTYAKVDKVNREIELAVKDISDNSEAISTLVQNSNSISGSVESLQKDFGDALEDVNNSITEVQKKVDATMTSEQVDIAIKESIKGVNEITTETGFTFNKDGLTVSKSGQEMKTQITEDGMKVFKDNTEVLTANNTGVNARNLHANTYLIIGKNSRFEDYKETRTGCFYIGG